jgi:hypothetical protein
MNLTTRAERMQIAHQLREALRHRAPDDSSPYSEGPRGNCGRGPDEECGMRDPQECEIHAEPANDDPALLNYAGTLASRRQQLKAARRFKHF